MEKWILRLIVPMILLGCCTACEINEKTSVDSSKYEGWTLFGYVNAHIGQAMTIVERALCFNEYFVAETETERNIIQRRYFSECKIAGRGDYWRVTSNSSYWSIEIEKERPLNEAEAVWNIYDRRQNLIGRITNRDGSYLCNFYPTAAYFAPEAVWSLTAVPTETSFVLTAEGTGALWNERERIKIEYMIEEPLVWTPDSCEKGVFSLESSVYEPDVQDKLKATRNSPVPPHYLVCGTAQVIYESDWVTLIFKGETYREWNR